MLKNKLVSVVLSKDDWSNILESIRNNRVLYDKVLLQLDKVRKEKSKPKSITSVAEKFRSKNLKEMTVYEIFVGNALKNLKCKISPQKIFYYSTGKSIKPNRFFIVDFYIPKYKCVVEVDGKQHYTEEGLRDDNERSKMLILLGVEKIVRIKNSDCNLNNINNLLDSIRK